MCCVASPPAELFGHSVARRSEFVLTRTTSGSFAFDFPFSPPFRREGIVPLPSEVEPDFNHAPPATTTAHWSLQEGDELVIKPADVTPPLDSSQWPLLLKVRRG